MIEEILVYNYQDLIADFGGYLGLLLGASIISMYDIVKEFILKIKNSTVLKFWPKSNETDM